MKRLISLLWILGIVIILQAQDTASHVNPFGIVEGFWFPEKTCELGVGWERIIFNWEQHQPNGPDDWYTLNVDDRWLRAASACDREVVALLKHTPAWATGGTPGIGVPDGLDLPVNDPQNYWANFIRKTVDYYASRGVFRFIIWNEPDISSETYGYEFEGDLEAYYQMVRIAYLVAKQTNPAVQIHLAGTTYWHDVNEGRQPYMTRLVERIIQDPEAERNDYYFDVLSLHIYFRTDSVYEIVSEMRVMLDTYGLADKSIWINETNAAPTDDPDWPVNRPVFQLSLVDQSAFLLQSVSLGLAAGAERIAVYKLYDQQLPPGGESFGILSPFDASPRPAYKTWQAITQHLDDIQDAVLVQSESVNVVRLTHATGRETFVAWARGAQSVTLEIPAMDDKAYHLDQYGTITILRPVDAVYRLLLEPATCEDGEGCFLGGSVRIFTQAQNVDTVREIQVDQQITILNFESGEEDIGR